ncbi:glycosyltransferase family 4 protein [Microbacterium sp. NPDC055455]
MSTSNRTLRLIPELRNYHIANRDDLSPSDTFYFERKYDLVGEIPDTFQQVAFRRALRLALSGRYTQLVMWEPLWVRLLPKHGIVILAWKLGTIRRRPVLSFAMENNSLASLMTGGRSLPRWAVAAFGWVLGSYIRFAYARIAYASDGARRNYERLPGVRQITSTTIPNLPARGPLSAADGAPGTVVMVARMESRKGTGVIVQAWPEVEKANPDARLRIVGSGPDSDLISRWAAESPDTREFLGAQAHESVMRIVADAQVLVLPSVRDGRWREQIGLPIHEALLNGLTVVTTDETGLADWLASRGHYVVPMQAVVDALPAAILGALNSPISRHEVVSQLPDRDARVVADLWLTGASNAP